MSNGIIARRGRIQKHKERLQAQIQALDLHPIFNPPLDHFHASLANEVLGDCQRGLNGVRGVRLSLLEALVVWVNGGVTLCNSLRLYALETSTACLVADRWVLEDGFWHAKWAWRRHPSGRASGELDLLISLINSLVLDSNLDDKWVWSLDDSGVISVKTVSRVVQDKLFSNNDPDLSFTLNSWVPRKVMFVFGDWL
ncbi:hypothetical protein Tco_0856729 [Tanacetum coccineum]|uniref:Uncharacterized protein n=1 Tax=Tanacetum coccineum TaxID=301880 RepID=A0ABQ5B7M9_9ASTR